MKTRTVLTAIFLLCSLALALTCARPLPALAEDAEPAVSYQSELPRFETSGFDRVIDDLNYIVKPGSTKGTVFSGAAWDTACGERAPSQCGEGYKRDWHFIDPAVQTGDEYATWMAKVGRGGIHQVWVSFVSSAANTTAAHYLVTDSVGTKEVIVDQTQGSHWTGQQLTWALLGQFYFATGFKAVVKEVNAGGDGFKIADAVAFQYLRPRKTFTISGRTFDDMTWKGPDLELRGLDNTTVRTWPDIQIYAVRSNYSGEYLLTVPEGWSGTVVCQREYFIFHGAGGTTTLKNVQSDVTLNVIGTYWGSQIPPPGYHP